jgi:hypothetical protein
MVDFTDTGYDIVSKDSKKSQRSNRSKNTLNTPRLGQISNNFDKIELNTTSQQNNKKTSTFTNTSKNAQQLRPLKNG